MAELVDALGLEPSAERLEGSSPSARTSFFNPKKESKMVNAQVEELSPTRKKISVEVPKEVVSKCLAKAYQKVGAKAKIKGFRPGKIPKNMLDKFYGPEIDLECLNFMVDDTYPEALYSSQLIPLTKPKFDVSPLNRDQEYKYAVEVEVKPTFELKDYKGMKIKKENASVTEEEIQQELKQLQERMAELEPAGEDVALDEGVVASISFEGSIDGKPFEGGSSEDYSLSFGTGHFLQEFEDKIKGMKAGEEKTIEVTFPEDYFQKAVANKKADFKVKVKKIYNKKLPKLDDELAKDIGKKDLNEVKEEIKKLYEQHKEQQARQGYVEQIREVILKSYDFEIPQGLVEMEVERSQGQQTADQVKDQIRYEFVLEAIALKEKLEPNPQDIDNRLAAYAQIYRKSVEEVRDLFVKNKMIPHLMSGILIDKALNFIIENAA